MGLTDQTAIPSATPTVQELEAMTAETVQSPDENAAVQRAAELAKRSEIGIASSSVEGSPFVTALDPTERQALEAAANPEQVAHLTEEATDAATPTPTTISSAHERLQNPSAAWAERRDEITPETRAAVDHAKAIGATIGALRKSAMGLAA